jgi:iron-sulfur cluster insertion protein
MITVTESAQMKIADILIEEGAKYVRTFVQGGGCSGFQYGFTMDDEKNEDDFEIPFQVYGSEFVVLVDSMSMTYLTGAIVDYKEDINGSQFNIKNPNAQTTCGCGSSFSA